MTTPHFDQTLHASTEVELLELAKQFLCNRVFPHDWSDEEAVMERCTDGITNKLIKVTNTRTNHIVLVRVYGHGTSVIINRADELATMRRLSDLKEIPPVYCTFTNGLVYGFIPGRVLLPDELFKFHPLITQQMAKFHRIQTTSSSSSSSSSAATAAADPDDAGIATATAWDTMSRWLLKVPSQFPTQKKNDLYQKNAFLHVESLQAEMTELKKAINDAISSPIVFCHNDLLAANIIYQPSDTDGLHNIDEVDGETASTSLTPVGSSSTVLTEAKNGHSVDNNAVSQKLMNNGHQKLVCNTGKLIFIDYEYGSLNMRGFDIGNHFNEYAGFECDYSRYPCKRDQEQWLKAYLHAYNGCEPTAQELQDIYREVNKYALVSHFFWAVWALVQASVSDLEFDYMGYSVLRLTEYYKRKHELLSL